MQPLHLLLFITLGYGKIVNMPKLDEFYAENYDLDSVYSLDTDRDLHVRVFKLNEWDAGILKKASQDETQEFFDYAGPLIEQYKTRPRTPIRVKKDDPEKPYRSKLNENITEISTDDIRNNIFKLINKFNMYSKPNEGSPDLLKNDEESSITLYFYGPYTSMLLMSRNENFHYFIPPPSTLPDWFYEENSNTFDDQDVQVPETIKNTLYKALLQLLQLVISHVA